MIGFLITVIMGLLASFATGPESASNIDERLLTPVVKNNFLSEGKLDSSSKLTGTVNISLDLQDEVDTHNGNVVISDKAL